MMYRHKLILLRNTYLQEIHTLEQEITMLPTESFFICKNGSYSKWIQTLNGKSSSLLKNPHHPEYATLKSPSGHLVRSKSELLIDMALFQHQLPFRYECQLLLSGIAFYPDFTIRHPKSGKIFYWEHFGMMNNLNYSKKTFEKLQIYNNHNILPDFNLITTYETTNHPLNLDVIENKIEFFFS